MSLHYLLDGYNVIKRIDLLADKSLEGGREALIRFLENYRPHGSHNNRCTIIFDGQADISSPPSKSSIKVTFTEGESADDKIKRLVASSSNKKECVVVTDDRDIQYYVRNLGAQVLSVNAFMQLGKSGGTCDKGSKIKLSPQEQQSINKELEDLWLGNDENDA